MPETKQIIYSYKEVVEALIRYSDIHEGIWGIFVRFGISGANVGTTPEAHDEKPAAIVPVQEIGLVRVNEVNNLSVDASIVNPIKVKA